MPQVLTMTRIDGETDEEFATRIAEQSNAFFGKAAPESAPATDVPADTAVPQEEPAPSA